MTAGQAKSAKHMAILAEIVRELEQNSHALLASRRGKLFWLTKTLNQPDLNQYVWILRAQEGTLEKLLTIVPGIDPSRGMELVSIARNIFENLIWLRLFNLNHGYGLLFYKQLLEAQIDSDKQAIHQAEIEIGLFEDAHNKDRTDFGPVDHLIAKASALTGDEAVTLQEYLASSAKKVDEFVRRSFSLYADQAVHNGYGYQAYLLREKVIPQHKERRAENEQRLAVLKSSLQEKLDSTLYAESSARWNWKQRAQSVGMEDHYAFIYSYTSRLLHSTPLNIITPKELEEIECDLLLNYIRTAILDAHEVIRALALPVPVNVFVLQS